MNYSERAYLVLMDDILASGDSKEDRTGVGTFSKFMPPPLKFWNVGTYFPLMTTKKMAWKSILAETLWFVQGRYDLESLRADGCHWWDDWEKPDGTIGPGYGYQLRHWPVHSSKEMVQVRIREDAYADYDYPYITEFKEKLDYDLNSDECWAVGFLNDLTTPKVEIQFKSGYLTSTTRANWRASIRKGTLLLRDGYQRTASGVGFKGYPKNHTSRVYNLWYNMLARCYNPEHPQFRFYGGAGVTVSPIWHSLEGFIRTLPLVIGYHEWVNGTDMHLDKDYYGSSVYSPNTSVFITPQTNQEMCSNGQAVEVGGVKYPSMKAWEVASGLDYWYASKKWSEGSTYHNLASEDVKILEPDSGYLWRRKIEQDQLAWIINEIKTNPTSRRLVATMWNAGELDDMALPPCHGALIQFYTGEGDEIFPPSLDLMVHIRSSDTFLGLPTNIAGYALLLRMVAQVTGRVASTLTVSLGDAHVYKNHVDAVLTQTEREPFGFPELVIDPSVKDIDDFRPEHFTLKDYQFHPKISAPIAV